MERFIRYKWLLIVVVIAAFLRLWQLGVVPSSPDWDEVALGYNAYSILKTGRDEYGTWFPRSLRSYDDYKPPLYVYLTVPSVALFGLNTWSVRLPSAVMGVLAVVGTYFLVIELFSQAKISDVRKLALTSAMLLAISPWHLQFSRIAFEANIGITLNVWGVVAFIKGLQSRKWLRISAILFGLALYAYHSERLFIPLLVLLLALVFRKKLFNGKTSILQSAIVGLLVILPLIPVFFNKTTLTRLRGTSALADQTLLLSRSVQKLAEDQVHGNPWGIIFDNRRIVWTLKLLDGYLSHYSFKWLFLTGDNPRHHAPDMGLLYVWEAPFLLWGMYTIARRGSTIARVLFGWFLIAPIAAAPTTELPHAIRTLVFLPTFQIFTAVGILQSVSRMNSKINRGFLFLLITSLLLLIVFNLTYYFHMYFGHMNLEVSQFWQYGYKQAVDYAQSHKSAYKKIVVSTKLEQPHMYFLFYTSYDPRMYLARGGTKSGGFAEERNRFDIYEFRPIEWEKEIHDGSVLYIGTPAEINQANLKTITYLDQTEAMRIAD